MIIIIGKKPVSVKMSLNNLNTGVAYEPSDTGLPLLCHIYGSQGATLVILEICQGSLIDREGTLITNHNQSQQSAKARILTFETVIETVYVNTHVQKRLCGLPS